MNNETITLVVTSCGRPDLLKQTLESFDRFNIYPIEKKILIEDSANLKMERFLKRNFESYFDLIIYNRPKLGHLKSIDRAYKEVHTPYIFHCEDDWEFVRKGFIEDSFLLLNLDTKMINIWLRGVTHNNEHLFEETTQVFNKQIKYRCILPGRKGFYRGFTLNPTVKRMSDYQLIKGYADLGSEGAIVEKYQALGYYAITFEDVYIKHIGGSRHVPLPNDSWLRMLKLSLRNRLKRWAVLKNAK